MDALAALLFLKTVVAGNSIVVYGGAGCIWRASRANANSRNLPREQAGGAGGRASGNSTTFNTQKMTYIFIRNELCDGDFFFLNVADLVRMIYINAT